ncbi:hypothetical protein [Polynucleobacter sp. IMCC 29146]|uniref:hypothetical protein n=1 Tax=Polynucleobacter sp. IMCC 29146 TaxID=2780953 RepID=UPI001F394224|nr:hypothetical protein [Polynucleobacter sp. IMCC 29146]MCE7530638.1 hypothetical protein [Polynucleobacter sp. IMCC 29146]
MQNNEDNPNYIVIFLNCFAVILASLLAYYHNTDNLFNGLDGLGWLALINEEKTFFPYLPNIYSNLLAGIGNLSVPANYIYFPPYWIDIFSAGSNFNPVPSYIGYALISFLSILLIGRSFHFQFEVSILASWFFILIIFPFYENFNINKVVFLVPNFSILFLFLGFFIYAISLLQVSSTYKLLLAVLVLLIDIIYLLLANPIGYLLVAPLMFCLILISIIESSFKRKLIQIIVFLLMLFLFYLVGWIDYLVGFFINSAYVIFKDKITQSVDASILLTRPFEIGGYAGRLLFIGASLGAALELAKKSSKLKTLASLCLLLQLAIIGCYLINSMSLVAWKLPQINFYETIFSPLYCLFFCHLIYRILNYCKLFAYEKFHISFNHLSINLFYLGIIFLSIITLNPGKMDRKSDYPLPESTILTKYLESKIGIKDETKFRGRVLSVWPDKNIVEQREYFYKQSQYSKNDHLTAGLWLHLIPTLHEYSPIISPSFFWIIDQFLSSDDVMHVRNWTLFTKLDMKILRMLGVSYILSPKLAIEGGKKVLSISNENNNLDDLNLFSIANANINGISILQIKPFSSLMEASEVMHSAWFDLDKAAVEKAIYEKFKSDSIGLKPAINNSVRIEKGGYKINATSDGISLLMLPIEYSNCVNIKVITGDKPTAVRVNVTMLGLLFAGDLDVMVVNETGLLNNPKCMLKNYEDFIKLKKNF